MSSSPSSFEHYSSSSRSLDEISEQKKRKREITAMNASKIPMDDIRRRYPSIMKDVLNSSDPEKCRALLKNHCVGALTAVYRYVGNNKSSVASDHVEIKDCQALYSYWEALGHSIPDGLMDIVETKFRLLPNKQSSIVCKFLFSGTKILRKSTDGISAVLFSSTRQSSGAQQRGGEFDDGQSSVYYAPLDRDCPDKIDYEKKRPFTFDEDLPLPQKIAIIGTLTLFTDCSHKIFRMEFIFSLKT